MASKDLRPSPALVEGDADGLRALEAAGIGTWHWDLATDRVSLSAHARGLIGAPDAVLDYPAFLAKMHPDDRDSIDQALRQSLAKGDDFDLDFRTAPGDGKPLWLRIRGGVFAAPGELRGILIDIIKRKASEEANSRLAAIVASSEDAIVGKTL